MFGFLGFVLVFYCESDKRLEQVAQRDCEVSFCADAENLTEPGLGQPASAVPALAGGLNQKLPGDIGPFNLNSLAEVLLVLFSMLY